MCHNKKFNMFKIQLFYCILINLEIVVRKGVACKMDLQEVGGGSEDWMELAQDRDRWRALVSTVMNLRVPKMLGIS